MKFSGYFDRFFRVLLLLSLGLINIGYASELNILVEMPSQTYMRYKADGRYLVVIDTDTNGQYNAYNNLSTDRLAHVLQLFIKDLTYNQAKTIEFSPKILQDCINDIQALPLDITGHPIKTHLVNKKKLKSLNVSAQEIKDHLIAALKEFFNVLNTERGLFKSAGLFKSKVSQAQLKIQMNNNFSDIAKPFRAIYFALGKLGESFGFSLLIEQIDRSYAQTIRAGLSYLFPLAVAGAVGYGVSKYRNYPSVPSTR